MAKPKKLLLYSKFRFWKHFQEVYPSQNCVHTILDMQNLQNLLPAAGFGTSFLVPAQTYLELPMGQKYQGI